MPLIGGAVTPHGALLLDPARAEMAGEVGDGARRLHAAGVEAGGAVAETVAASIVTRMGETRAESVCQADMYVMVHVPREVSEMVRLGCTPYVAGLGVEYGLGGVRVVALHVGLEVKVGHLVALLGLEERLQLRVGAVVDCRADEDVRTNCGHVVESTNDLSDTPSTHDVDNHLRTV